METGQPPLFLLLHEQGAVWAVALESSMAAKAAKAAKATFIMANWRCAVDKGALRVVRDRVRPSHLFFLFSNTP